MEGEGKSNLQYVQEKYGQPQYQAVNVYRPSTLNQTTTIPAQGYALNKA